MEWGYHRVPLVQDPGDLALRGGLLDVFPSGPGRVVVVQAVDAQDTMVLGLRKKAWNVVAMSPYRTVSATPSADQYRQPASTPSSTLHSPARPSPRGPVAPAPGESTTKVTV